MAIKRGVKGIKRHHPMNGLRHPGYKLAAGQSRRFIAWSVQQNDSVNDEPVEPVELVVDDDIV